MKWTSTLRKSLKNALFIFLSLVVITLTNSKSYAQAKTYATVTPSSGLISYNTPLLGSPTVDNNPGPGAGSVLNPGNAATSSTSTFATLTCNYYNVLGLTKGEGEAWLQLKYPTSPTVGKTTYIRFDTPTSSGLSLDLLAIVGDLTGLLKKNLVELDLYNGATSAADGTLVSDASASSEVVKDAQGNTYFAVTSTVPYNSVRIRLRFRGNLLGLALGASVSMKVYNGFTVTDQNCAPSIFTNIGESTGLNVSLTSLLLNPEKAIDGDMNTSSTIQAGLVTAGGTSSQTIYLNGLSGTNDYAKVVLSIPASVLSVDVFKTITVQGYNGNTAVGQEVSVGSLLSLDLLGLLSNKQKVPIFFKPGAAFDRVKIKINTALAVGGNLLSGGLNVYEVQQTVAKPAFGGLTNGAASVCGNQVSLSVNNPDGSFTYNWYRSTGNVLNKVSLASASGSTYIDKNLPAGTYTYYLSAQKSGCAGESDLDSAKITVTAIPAAPTVATVAPVCIGSPATATISNPVAGVTYSWYAASTGGTALATGSTFTTPALASTTTYYVEAAQGTCVSTARTAVTVTVNPATNLPVVTTNSTTISPGQTATLQATADIGNTINWYTASTGGTAIATGPSFTTPALSATTTYYVEAQSAAGCVSATRVPVTVTVTSGPVNPNCNAAIKQQSGIDGLLCLLCGVTNPGNSIDADVNNFTRINLAVGVAATGYQRLIFANPGASTDSIRLDLATPVGLADLSVLGGITVKVYNGSTLVNTYPLNSSLLNLQLLSGNRFKATLPAGGVYDRVEIRFGAVVAALSSLDIYGAEVIYPNPTVATTGRNICSGSTASLSAAANGGTTLKWYAAATGGTALATGATFTTPALTASTTYYIEVISGTCANAQRVPVTVTVNPAIVFATTTLSNATVASTYSKQINAATGGTPTFTYTIDPSTPLPAGLSLAANGTIGGTPTAAGNFNFSVIATDSKGCTATAAYTLKVTAALALPTATLPNGVVGTIYPVQTLPAATGGTTPYTYVATNLPPGLTFDPATRQISGTPTQKGTYTIPVTATDANGNTISTDYTIIVRDPLVLPTATLADGTVGKPYPTQTIPQATGGNGPYTYLASNIPLGLTFDPATHQITGTPTLAGNYTIPVKVTDADGSTITTNYTIKVTDPLVLPAATLPDGTTGVIYATQTLPSATGGTGPYTYLASNLPLGINFDPATRQISGTPAQSGSFNISVKVTDAANATATQTYALKVNGVLSLPSATLADGLVGTPYATQTLPAVTGTGTAPYTYTATGLPAGLTFNAATRQISGTPTIGGTFTVKMTVTDANGLSTSTDYALKVNVAAPIVAAANTCNGTTTTLTVSNIENGVTYNWYAATGSTSVFTGTTFTTPALTTNTTYYVEAVSGTAVSTRTAVNVNINPAPALASVSTNSETISAGQTATLMATADAGNTINWYAASTGGTAIATGTSFTTPALSATTTYYVETQSAAGCVSATRVPVTVTVTSGPVNPNCNAAIKQQSGINGLLCLLCGISNPGNSTDADVNNFTRINLAVGVAATGYQRLIFANQGASTDSIRLDLATPVGLADLSVLGGITVKVYNGSTLVNTYPLNSSLLNLQLLVGNRFKATLPAGGVYDRVEVSFGAVVAALSSLDIYGAEVIYPNPTVATTGRNICSGSTASLSAAANGGTTLKWYAAATGGTALATGATFTTPALTASTTYYIEVIKGTCANAQRVPVTVTVNPAIIFATTTLSNATVASAYSKQINAATGGTPGFTYTIDPSTPLPAGLSLAANGAIGGTPTAAGNFNFSVIATDSKGCTATATYTLKVTAALALPTATLPNGIVGTIYPVQTLPAATGGTTPYTYVATNLPPGLTFDPATRQISGTPTQKGTYTIPVTATDANGNTVSTDYTIIVRDPLVLPAATLADGTVGKPYPTQTIPQATGGNGPYTYTATGLPPGLSFDPATHQITGTPTLAGNYTIPVKVTDADGSTITTNYTIKVTDPLVLPAATLPDGTTGVIYATQTLPSATGGTGPYTYLASNLPLGINFDPATRQISGTPAQSGSFNISVKVTDAANATATQTYALKVNGVLSLPNATLADGLVGTPYATQTLPAVTGTGTAPYTYSATGLPDGLTFNPATRQISGTPTIGGTFTVKMTVTDANGLSTSTDYALKVNVAPPVVAAANSCNGTTATLTVSNIQTGVTYNWYAATGSTPVFTGTTFTTPALTANTTYYVEAVSGTAVSTRTAVNVTLNPAPALASVSTNNETISAGQTVTLMATADAGNTINWYAAATGGTAIATGPSFTTPALSATTTYYVETQSAAGCVSATRVPVTVTVTSGPVNPNCNAAIKQQSGIDGLLCLLCGISDPGNSTDADVNNFTRINLAVGVAATGYQRLIFANPGASTDSIRLDLATPVGLADLSVLGGITVKVYNGSTLVKTYPLNSSLLNLQLLVGNRFKATLPAGGVYDRVEVSFGAVVAALSSLDIYGAEVIYPNPTVATTGRNICSGSTTTLSATANGGTTLKWYAAATGGTALATGATFTTPALTANTTYYIEVIGGTCANAQRVPVTVTVTNTPTAPLVSAPAAVCSGSTATLTINSPVTGVTYNWYAASTGGTILATGSTFTTPALTAATTYYAEAASGTCTSNTRTAVAVNVNPLPADAVVTTNNPSISAGQTATLAATAPAGVTINWYAAPTGGSALATGATFTTPALTATTTYYVETTNATGCTSPARIPVTVTVIGGPVNPNCNAASKQESGIEGICLLCAIQNPGNSTDNNFTNFTTISLPVGVGGSGYQRLIFNNTGSATDSIRLNLETPTGLADVTVLGGIQVKIMNGTSVVKTYNLSSSLLYLQLLNGNRFTATLPATGVFDRVEVRAQGLVSALINLNIYGAEVIYPNPTVAATGRTICAGNATTLSAAANGGTTLRWYSAPSGGTLLQTGENFTTPVLSANTTYYIEVSKGGCANVNRVPVQVTVTSAPAVPVVAAVPAICAGSSAVIPVSNPITGVTYQWYTAATGGTPVFTGATFTTPALTSNTTYYVEAASGTCTSATRTPVLVSVNPLPALPVVQASATTINAGQTAILTATSTDTNVTFNWYTSATSTTPVYTGPTYVTPPLTVTTTYYLEAKSTTTTCSAPSRVQVTINVNGGGSPNPVPCQAATTESNGVTGVAVLAGVFNPQLAIDNDTKTGSSLVMPVGLLNASVYQRLGFSGLSSIGDTVRISLTSPGKLLSLGLLSSIQIGTYSGNTSNNDALAINNPLIHLELLSGNTEALISFVPAKQFDQVEVRLNAGLAGVLSTVDVNYAQRIVVAPEVTASNVTTCINQTATLTVKTPVSGITYKWYDATGTYQAGKDGASFTTPALTASTKYYVEANIASGCTSYRTPVAVTVNPAPAVPVLVSPTINTCSGNSVTLEISNPVSGVIYQWYNAAGDYQTGKDGTTFTILNFTTNTTYSVEAKSDCGISGRATATITTGTLDKPVVTPASVTIASGSPAVLTATSSTAGAVFKWYDSPVSNTVLFTGARYVTGPLVNNTAAPITKTYYVTAEVSGGTCAASARASVDVTINPQGNTTDVPCEGATVDVRYGVDGVALLTAVFNPQLAVDNKAESASSFVMPVGVLGASVYQQVGFQGLSNIGDTVRVRVSSPGKLLSLAVLPSIELTTFNGLASNNDMITASNPIIHLELLSDNSGAIFSFVPQKQFDGVELRLRSGLAAVLTTLDFNYAQRVAIAPSVQVAATSVCEGNSAILNVKNPVSGTTYRWYKGTTYLTGKDGISLTTDATLAAGTYDYFVTALRNNCESAKTKVTVTVLPAPAAPVPATGNPVATCPNTPATLGVMPVAGVSFNWYDAPAAGNLLAANTNTYTTPANLAVGIHNFYVEAVNGNSCVSTAARTLISITVNPTSLASDITVTGDGAPFCTGNIATLTATSTTVTNPIFTWYSDAALTNAVFTGAKFVTPALTATTTYYVTVSGTNKCANTAADAKIITLTVNPPATAADLDVTGNELPFCANATATLTATTTTVTNPVFTWYTDAALSNAVFTGPKFVTPALTATTTYYVTVKGDNRCENVAASPEIVTLIVNPPAIASDISVAGAELPFCANNIATLTASSTTVTNPVFTWYSDAALTNAVFTGAKFVTPALTATTTYYVTVRGSNKCENTASTAKAVTLTVNPPATAADINVAGAENPFCAGTAVKLTASSVTVTNPVFTWYSDAALTNAVFTGPVYNIPAISATTTYYVSVTGSNRCANLPANGKAVTVTVNPPALASDLSVSGADAPFCSGNMARLTATSTTVTNPVFTWYSDAALTTAVFTGPVFNTPALTATTTYYVTVRGSNKCENTAANAKIITLKVNPPAVAADVIVSGAGTPFCAGTSAKLTASSTTVTNPVFTWYTDAALTNAVFTGAIFDTPVLTATTTYYVTVRGDNKCENTAANARVVTLNVNPPATAADIAVTGADAPVCAGNTAKLIATTTTVTSPVFTWYSDAALTNAVFTGATFTTPALTTTTTYYVTVRGSNKCENTAATAKAVTVTVNPPALASDINVAGAETPFCANTSAKLTASSVSVTNPVFTWYSDAALTNAVFTGAVFNTPALTATTTYYVTVRGDNRCENTAANAKVVTVTVNPPALASDITVNGADAAYCAGTSAKLTASSTTVTSPVFTWYTDAALTNAVFTGPVFDTPALTATTTYYVTVRGSNKCDNTAANAKVVTVKVNPPAVAADVIVSGAGTPFCAGTSAKLTASSTTVTNPVFTWYTDAALTNAVFTGAIFDTPVLTATTTYYVTVRGDNKCENGAADARVVTLNVNPPATAADIDVTGADAPVCSGNMAKLIATTTTVTNPVFTWYSDAALTNAVFTGATFTTPALTTTTTYYVTVRGSNRCENTAATAKAVTVTVNPPALASDINVAGAETPFCANTSAKLTASSVSVTNPVFTWYSDAALTNAVFTGAVFNTPALTATTTYYVTVRGDNRCENTAANAKVVTVTVNPPATSADVSVSGTTNGLCAGSSTQLTATSTTVTNPVFTWYTDAALTNAVFTGSIFNTPALSANTMYYVTVRGDNKCENTAATAKAISISVNPPATAADITATGTTICAGTTTQLTASSTTVTNPVFTWYSDAALTDALFTGSQFTTPSLTANTTYYVTVRGDNKCANAAGDAKVVVVTVNQLPETPVIAGTGLNICAGDNTVITVQNPMSGVSYNWYASATGGSILFTGSEFTTPALQSTTDYYVEAISMTGCGNATGRVKVTVTVSPKPIAPTVSASSVNTCSGSAAVLSVENPQNGITYNWYNAATGGTILGSGINFTTPVITANTTFYVEATSATCISVTRTAVNVNVSTAPDAPASVSVAGAPLCPATTTTLTVNNPDPALTYRWYSAATGGTILATGNTFTTPVLNANTTYYVESLSATGCTSTTRTAVVVNVLPALTAPVVTVQSATPTSVTFGWNPVAGALTYEVSIDGGITWIAPSSGANGTTHVINGLKPTDVVHIRVRAKGQSDCQTSAFGSADGTADNPLKNGVFIPNTFTPNGDGKNDIFYVYGNTIAQVKMRIYNQWGQFIYESLNIQNGWDGTYKGQLQPNGVYVYQIELVFTDGTTDNKKGTITLLR